MAENPDDHWPPSELVTLLEDAVHALNVDVLDAYEQERIVRVAVLPTLQTAGWLRTSPVDTPPTATSATLSAQRREGGAGSQWPPDALVERCMAALGEVWRGIGDCQTPVTEQLLVRAVLAEVRRTDVTPDA